jgi:hypothetical protein
MCTPRHKKGSRGKEIQQHSLIKLYLACSKIITIMVQPATSVVFQTLICLDIYIEDMKPKNYIIPEEKI